MESGGSSVFPPLHTNTKLLSPTSKSNNPTKLLVQLPELTTGNNVTGNVRVNLHTPEMNSPRRRADGPPSYALVQPPPLPADPLLVPPKVNMFMKKATVPPPTLRSKSPQWDGRLASADMLARKPLKVCVAAKKPTNHDITTLGMPSALISDRGLPLPKKGPSAQALLKTQTDVIIKLQEENRLLDAIAERQELLLRARGTNGQSLPVLEVSEAVDPMQALREGKQMSVINQLRSTCAALKGNLDANTMEDNERVSLQVRSNTLFFSSFFVWIRTYRKNKSTEMRTVTSQ